MRELNYTEALWKPFEKEIPRLQSGFICVAASPDYYEAKTRSWDSLVTSYNRMCQRM